MVRCRRRGMPPLPPLPPLDVVLDMELANRSRQPYLRHADVLNLMTNKNCHQKYRMKKSRIRMLVDMMHDQLKRPTNRHGALKPQEQVLAMLRFLAGGSEQQVNQLNMKIKQKINERTFLYSLH